MLQVNEKYLVIQISVSSNALCAGAQSSTDRRRCVHIRSVQLAEVKGRDAGRLSESHRREKKAAEGQQRKTQTLTLTRVSEH